MLRKKSPMHEVNGYGTINLSAFQGNNIEISKNMKRKEPIANILIKARIEHDAKMEELRKEKENRELNQLSSPKISKQARSLKRSEPAYERLFEIRKHNLDKREQLRNRIEEEKRKEMSGKPNINVKSKKLTRGIEDQIEWANMQREKKEEMKRQLDEKERQQIQKPKINSISIKLAKMQDRSKSVFDHLLEQHKKKQLERAQKLLEEKLREVNSTIPTISAHSANLHRGKPVFDRLYTTSMEIEEKKRRLIAHNDMLARRRIDPHTGRRTHSPQINPRSQNLKRTEPVENILLRKALERKTRIEEARRREMMQIKDFQNIRIGEYSRFLAELLERKTNISSQERLYQFPIHANDGKSYEMRGITSNFACS